MKYLQKLGVILLILVALLAVGCTGNDTTSISTSDDDMDIEVNVTESSEDEGCPVGTTFQASNPQGETVTMTIVGTEIIDGVNMCKAVYESNIDGEDLRVEHFWSEDGETFMWIAYDSSGNVASKVIAKDGKITAEDEEGNVVEFGE